MELQAPSASANEFVCGALLLAGLFTRLATIPLMVTMVVAIVTAQRDNVWSLNDLFGLSGYLYIALLVRLATPRTRRTEPAVEQRFVASPRHAG